MLGKRKKKRKRKNSIRSCCQFLRTTLFLHSVFQRTLTIIPEEKEEEEEERKNSIKFGHKR